MKFRTAKRPHRAEFIDAPIWGLQHGGVYGLSGTPHRMITLENHKTGGFIDLVFTADDVESPYFDSLIENLVELRAQVRVAKKGSK